MLKTIKDSNNTKEILLSLRTNSGTLAGISIALVGIINPKPVTTGINRFDDDLFKLSAPSYRLACYLVLLLSVNRLSQLILESKFIDIVFVASLTMLVLAGF